MMLQTTSIRRAIRRVRRVQARNWFKLLVLSDVERLLPSEQLIEELQAAGVDEFVDRFAALAARLVELRCAIRREQD